MLSTVLGGLLLSVMLWVIKWAGKNFVLYAVALSLFIQIVMVIIFPIIIQPLFNKFTPLEDGDLKTAVEELASKVEFPLKKILVIDGSKRSGHSNAYFFGLFKNKRIVLYDTLIQQMSIDEAVAIVGHELGHWAHNDMFWGLVLNQLNILWIFYLLSLAINYAPLYTAFGFKTQPLIIGINLFSQLLTPLSLALSFLLTWFSRLREFRADRYAIDHGYGEHLPKALIKMYKENKSLVHPDWLYSMMHNSHPPPSERVAAMNAYTTKISKKQ
jgi:STE24 endopeptidase